MGEGTERKPKQTRVEGKTLPPVPNEGIGRIWRAFLNSMRGLQEGFLTESAIRQEIMVAGATMSAEDLYGIETDKGTVQAPFISAAIH